MALSSGRKSRCPTSSARASDGLPGLLQEALAGVAEDPGGGGGPLPLLDAHHHVDHAVRQALGGDAAVGLGRPGGVVGVAVVVADDLAALVPGLALDADEVLGGDLVAHAGRLRLAVDHGHHLLHRHLALPAPESAPPQQHAADLEGVAGARVVQDPLQLRLPDPHRPLSWLRYRSPPSGSNTTTRPPVWARATSRAANRAAPAEWPRKRPSDSSTSRQ